VTCVTDASRSHSPGGGARGRHDLKPRDSRGRGVFFCPFNQHGRAVELACRVIREYARAEFAQVEGQRAPAVAAFAAQIAELEDLIASRNALAPTLRPVVAELREKMATIQRANWRKAQGIKIAEIPAEEAYRAAVADMAATLRGSNVEAARAALRGLTGDIPVFEQGGKLYGRLTVDAVPLYSRCNPALIEQVGSGGRI
jgi:hypothetical protein